MRLEKFEPVANPRSAVRQELMMTGSRIVLLTTNSDEAEFTKEFGSDRVLIRPLVRESSHLSYLLQRLHLFLFETRLPTSTSVVKRQRFRRIQFLRYLLVLVWIRGSVGRALFRLWRSVDRVLTPTGHHAPIFEEFDPDLVVVSTLGREEADVSLIRLARERGVRTLAVLRGWDNLTTKEYVREKVDKLVVWNSYNKSEAVELHGFCPADVYVAGVSDFDVYIPVPYESRQELFEQHGLDPDRRLLVLSGQGGSICHEMGDIVSIIADAISGNRFVANSQLLVRPHPNVYSGATPGPGTEADLRRYEELSPHVHGDRPQIVSDRLKSDMSTIEMRHVADTLYHTDVLLDYFGTLTLEASIVDTPVIYVAFDGYKQRPYYDSCIRWRDYTHNRRIVDAGATRMALDADGLVEHINAYLTNPSLEREQRRRVVADNCFRTDGFSSKRLASCIAGFAKNMWPDK